jgi:hypothetical protein
MGLQISHLKPALRQPRYFRSICLRFALLPRAVDDLNLGDPRNNRCVNYHTVNYLLICLEKAVLLRFSTLRLGF